MLKIARYYMLLTTKNFNPYYVIILLYLICIFSISQAVAQTSTITGRVTSDRWPVNAALITFIDEIDTTIKFTATTDNSGNYEIGVPSAIMSGKNIVPADFELAQNYPNPFSSSTAIPYSLQKQSEIEVTIYDILGREIKKITVGRKAAGLHRIFWDGRNDFGQRVANGIYLYKLQAGGKFRVNKMILNSGENNLVPLQQIGFSAMQKINENVNKISNADYYTIRIENTNNTLPVILAQQFENIQVKNDTTINFNVDHLISVTVNSDSVNQYIRGFGASNVILWRPDMTESEVETAFGTGEDQVGFTILRIMVEADKNRWGLYVPRAKQAYNMGAIVIASPWHAPVEMRETIGDDYRVRYDMYDEYAAHLDSFITYMQNNDVPIYGLSIQNEPDIGEWTQWTPNEMLTFMRDYAHLISGTKVMAPESFHFNYDYSDPILNDSVSCANTDIVCGHIYGGGLAFYPLAQQKGKEVWMTEYLINSGNPPTDPSIDTGWTGAMQTAKSISDCMQESMSAYVWWNIIRYYGPISDGTNNSGSKGAVTKKGYVMSQFSRFIRPGDHRVDCGIFPPLSNVYATAYKDSLSSNTVIVAVNPNTSSMDMAFKVQNSTMNTCNSYTTTEFKNVFQGDVINITDNRFEFSLEASSITTFVLNQ
jgi:glucuronoarabinoxylan endo-1,4-beta-xylanase